MQAAVESVLAATRAMMEAKVGLAGEQQASEFLKLLEAGLGDEEKEYAGKLFKAYAPLALLIATHHTSKAEPDIADTTGDDVEELDEADWEQIQRDLDEMLS